MRECLLLSAAIVVLATPRLWAGSTTPFRLGDGGGVIVPVTLNGHGPFQMLLDTGATHSAITDEVADAIGAPVVAQTNVISPISGVLRPIVAVEYVVIGPRKVDLLLPSVVARGSFDKKAAIQGLIGQDVLMGLSYTLDFKRRVIEWHDAAPVHDGVPLKMVFEHGRFLVNLPQDRGTLRLVPDSGAEGIVLFGAHCCSSVEIVENGGTVQLVTADASRPVKNVRLRELHLGDRILRDVPAVTIDRPDLHPAEGDGLLPLHLFDRVTFDGPARLLIIGV
jgi:predicted aspartyl protease